jgi:hypothetical protein
MLDVSTTLRQERPMTDCSKQLAFQGILKLPLTVDFDGGNLTSDGGVLWLRSVDEGLGLTAGLVRCLLDRRDPQRVRHPRLEQLRQRIYQIACGYEDCNDADVLRRDPALKIAVGRLPESDRDLSSQPTLSRFENAAGERELKRLSGQLLRTYLDTRPKPAGRIVIGLDSTDDPAHGQQAFSFYHGFYRQHMFHPLLCFDGQTGDLLAVSLRPGNVHAANGAVKMLERIVKKIRRRWPDVEIVLRADGGFCVPRLYRWCERERVGYVIGLISNPTLKTLHDPLLEQAQALYGQSLAKARMIGEVGYRAGPWKRFRRVVMKAEVMPEGTNRRFVVTNLGGEAQALYDFYVGRGDVENRIKDLKNALSADRLSCCSFTANRFRLLLHAAAYVLLHHLRRALHGTELASAQFDTLRLRLLKAGARVKQSARRVWMHLASSYPYQELWVALHSRLLATAPS